MGNCLEIRPLRSRLLGGVAAAAMAASVVAGRAVAADPGSKWSPYVEAGGMVGTHSFGDVDIFIPVWQDQTSILFGDLRGTFSAQPTEEGNFGLGYRTQVSPEWILGGYGYFDIANSPNNNLFYQITLGVELKSVDWDFRLNGYIPINPDGDSISNNSNPHIKISGTTIQMTTESRDEKALYGFDGEVGWRVPVFPADGDFDIRVYAGGYYFTNGDVDTIAGPRGRIEARLYDIDFLGLQSRLTAQGVIQWDQPRGTQGWGASSFASRWARSPGRRVRS
jgi:Inverse autotransporter, beta-domain